MYWILLAFVSPILLSLTSHLDKYLFDNSLQILLQLLDCGIIRDNIQISDICTITNKNYHSYRRDKERSGRMAGFIGMIA